MTQINNIRVSLHNYTVIQLNSLRKWLGDPIEPVTAPVQVGNCLRYTVAKGFPSRVKDFWRLALNPTVLTELARHYSVRDWDRWKRATSRDTDVTCYIELQDMVTVYLYKCLRALAMTQGLQYSVLKRLAVPLQLKGLLRKRKADTDNGSR